MSEIKEELAKRAEGIKRKDTGEKAVEETQPQVISAGDGTKPAVRLLRADEIECRVSTVNEKGVSLLLFKDARVDQKILDETFTPFGWRRTHQSIEGNLYCTVEIWDKEKAQWIAKQDVGTTSYSEKEKGQASDSFKRACFNWGIGRELYTAPFIWVPAEQTVIQPKGDRFITADRFSVRSIAYNDKREITALVIVNKKGYKVFEMKQKTNALQGVPGEANTGREISGINIGRNVSDEQDTRHNISVRKGKGGITDTQKGTLKKELERTGVTLEAVLSRYHLREIGEMTEDIYLKALNGLKRSKTKEAA